MPLARCLQEVSSVEFAEHKADYLIEPWDHNDNLRTALLCCMVANSAPFRSGPAMQLQDFLKFLEPQRQSSTPVRSAPQMSQERMKAEWARAQANWSKPKGSK